MRYFDKPTPIRGKLLVFILVTVLIFSPLKLVSFLGLIILLSLSLPLKVNLFSRMALGFAVHFSLNTIFGGIAHILSIALPVELLLLLHLCFILTLRIGVQLKSKNNKDTIYSYFPSLIGLVVIGIIFALLTLPALRGGNYEIYRKVTFGGDNTSHIELIKAVIDRGGYFYENPINTGYVITENLAGYPQGFHYNAYVLIELMRPIKDFTKSYEQFLKFYYAYIVAIYLALASLYLVVIQTLAKRKNSESIIVGISVAGILFSGILFSLFALGFQTQIASLILLLAMLMLLHISSETTEARLAKVYFLLALIVLSGISFTWLFLLPVAGLIMLLYFPNRHNLYELFRFKKNFWFLLSLITLSAIVLIQPIIQMAHQTTKTSGVNEQGFTVIPNTLVVSSIMLLSIVLIPVVFKKSKILWYIVMGSSSFFSLYVYVYQWSRVGEARYYFHKSLFTLIILSSLVLVLAIGRFVDYILSTEPRQKKALLLSILITGIFLTTYNLTNKNDYFQKQDGGGFSAELAVTVGQLLEESPENGRRIIAVGSCNRAHDYTVSRLASTLTGEHDIWRQSLTSALLAPDDIILIKSIKAYQETRSPELIIISTDYGLQKKLESALNDGYGKEKYIDLDFGHIPKTPEACPHLVR